MVFKDEDVIFAYTRKQAIADGVLVDVTDMAKEAGFRIPVAMTSTVYVRYVEVPKDAHGQDIKGRLWDILHMLKYVIKSQASNRNELRFQVIVNNGQGGRKVTLKSVCGPGDEGEPCITIMLPDED
jgi:hypothetical protein